jgi:glycosyltransferase involved in cell wall biosynthesis
VLPARRLWTHTRLALELARHPPAVLFVPAHVLPIVVNVPSVVTVHDLGHRAVPEAHTAAQRLYLEWSTRRHARVADHIVADSASTRDDLVRLYGADPARITVVHLGVDAAFRPASPEQVGSLRAEIGLAPHERYLLHVGTLQPRKNLPRLLAAFAQVAAVEPDLVLVLAGGRGWGGDDLAAAADRLGIGQRVRHLGYASEESLPALYSGAQALVLPSLYEGFGLTALEAMACGCPVAASRASSLPEVVGDAGLLFDPLDPDDMARTVLALVRDGALRARLAAEGRTRAARFGWDRTAADVLAVLESVARGGGRA